MKAIHRKRLLKLAAFLAGPVARAAKRNKAKKLNMRLFASDSKIGLSKAECGTSACALGWATLVFPRVFSLYDSSIAVGVKMHGTPCGLFGAGNFFGLNSDESEHAFGPWRRTIPQEVAILRKLAAGK